MQRPLFDVLIIGAGVNGLATAYHLSSFKHLKIALLEQFELGHQLGSSHGASRMIRSTYTDPLYSKLVQKARLEEWPLLEKEIGSSLIDSNPLCLFGRGAPFRGYAQALARLKEIEPLEIARAKERFPQFCFDGMEKIFVDHSAGVIRANEMMIGLAKIAV